jgi:hypothetical protein
VKAAIQKEADGGTVGAITKETRRGKTYSEAKITKNGKDRYVNAAKLYTFAGARPAPRLCPVSPPSRLT